MSDSGGDEKDRDLLDFTTLYDEISSVPETHRPPELRGLTDLDVQVLVGVILCGRNFIAVAETADLRLLDVMRTVSTERWANAYHYFAMVGQQPVGKRLELLVKLSLDALMEDVVSPKDRTRLRAVQLVWTLRKDMEYEQILRERYNLDHADDDDHSADEFANLTDAELVDLMQRKLNKPPRNGSIH